MELLKVKLLLLVTLLLILLAINFGILALLHSEYSNRTFVCGTNQAGKPWRGTHDIDRSVLFENADDEVNYYKGEKLWKGNCTACHKIAQKVVGPPLASIEERFGKKWLYSFNRDSQQMIKDGDSLALKSYNEYEQMVMTSFPMLTDESIDFILHYIKIESTVYNIENNQLNN